MKYNVAASKCHGPVKQYFTRYELTFHSILNISSLALSIEQHVYMYNGFGHPTVTFVTLL